MVLLRITAYIRVHETGIWTKKKRLLSQATIQPCTFLCNGDIIHDKVENVPSYNGKLVLVPIITSWKHDVVYILKTSVSVGGEWRASCSDRRDPGKYYTGGSVSTVGQDVEINRNFHLDSNPSHSFCCVFKQQTGMRWEERREEQFHFHIWRHKEYFCYSGQWQNSLECVTYYRTEKLW